VKQDEDVLDTWFSAALWPFSLMGWPEQTKDFEHFFPGQLLETGYDIIFFWVARMVFLAQELCGKLPFKDVFLHAIIRDAHGRKMSKSLGNVIDPIDIIKGITLEELHKKLEYGNLDPKELKIARAGQAADFKLGIPECGTDALRFALLSYTGLGRGDINLDVMLIRSHRLFCNKIWQSFKFITMKLGDGSFKLDDKYQLTGHESATDKWILSCLSHCVASCNQSLESFQFQLATTALYKFWWDDFCNTYLEAIKETLRNDDASTINAIHQILYLSTETFLRLISPFMPFLTEELWQRLPKRSAEKAVSICVAAYPESDDYPFYDESLQCPMQNTKINNEEKENSK